MGTSVSPWALADFVDAGDDGGGMWAEARVPAAASLAAEVRHCRFTPSCPL